jgi:membrane associated rhomboid family serine protease
MVGDVKAKTLAIILTSIFMFAVRLVAFAKTDTMNLLAATAAYAAVLTALVRPT